MNEKINQEPQQTFDHNPELTQLHEALSYLRKAASILAANKYAVLADETNQIANQVNYFVSDNT